jgi:hypothetical protein
MGRFLITAAVAGMTLFGGTSVYMFRASLAREAGLVRR